ncbi:MAG TPA: hypothetical protein VEA44_12195 [Caulobacter sp.]|nr:hypothetical protein [Caulobacter sp.]
MLFDDDFAIGRWGSDGLGALEDLLGGPSRYDAGEVIITGRVPGALYVDDFSEYRTGLEHIQPLEAAQDAINIITVELAEFADRADLTTVEEPPASEEDEGEEASAALIAPVSEKTEEPLVLVTRDDGEPLAGGFGDLDLTDFGRPLIDLIPAPPIVSVTPPDMTGEQPAPVVPGGRAYQSLAFLILDTPFVVGDDNLPPSVRPPINELLGLDEDEDVATTWVLPTGRGAWILR